MKKNLSLLLAVFLICLFAAGCAKQSVETVAAQPGEFGNESDSAIAEPIEEEKVDVDLTALSSTMVYAEVNNIMMNPDEYLGKTVKLSGPYAPTYFEETGLYYHNILITDALACCQGGLEFKLAGESSYPEDYPEEYADIETTGVFGKYEELGLTYYYLEVDDFTVL